MDLRRTTAWWSPSSAGVGGHITSVLDAVGRQGLRLLDGLMLLGVLIGYEVRRLTSVSESAEASALAADRAGEALQSLRELPLVGEDAGELGDEVRAAAAEVLANAADSRATVNRLASWSGSRSLSSR